MLKIILIAVFVLIIASLGSALFHLVNRKQDDAPDKTAKALTVRIGLSVVLFIIVFILVATGILRPHGIGSKIYPQQQSNNQNTK